MMKEMKCDQSRADPYLFFKWDLTWGLVMWLTWIDSKLCIANAKHFEHEKELLKKHFQCDDFGKLTDYIECNLDISSDDRSLKMT